MKTSILFTTLVGSLIALSATAQARLSVDGPGKNQSTKWLESLAPDAAARILSGISTDGKPCIFMAQVQNDAVAARISVLMGENTDLTIGSGFFSSGGAGGNEVNLDYSDSRQREVGEPEYVESNFQQTPDSISYDLKLETKPRNSVASLSYHVAVSPDGTISMSEVQGDGTLNQLTCKFPINAVNGEFTAP